MVSFLSCVSSDLYITDPQNTDAVGLFTPLSVLLSLEQIPSVFIITGPNTASQDLLFNQLSETLTQSSQSRFVRLQSAEASSLKTALKKIIREATAKPQKEDRDDDGQLGPELNVSCPRKLQNPNLGMTFEY